MNHNALAEQHRGETSKARARRIREGFFEKYCQGKGIDIGCGPDPLFPDINQWDKDKGDATLMDGVPDETYDFVYSSHCLEHLNDPETAIGNWYRILKPGGYLVVVVPSASLYEKSLLLPSRWNPDHKTFWEPLYGGLEPHNAGLLEQFTYALGSTRIENGFRSLRVIDDGYVSNGPDIHSSGEYSIEIIIQK